MKILRYLQWLAVGLFLFVSLGFFLERSIAQDTENNPCFETIASADELFLAGEKSEARTLYRQCKPDFPESSDNGTEVPPPVYDIQQLEGGHKLWTNALDGIESNLDSKIFFNLVPLTQRYPQFIPASLKLADFCVNDSEFCERSAREGQPKTASEVLERVTELYPDNADLVKKKIELLALEEKYLEAAIDARQFSIVYSDRPEAAEFVEIADKYLGKFKAKINDRLVGQTVAGVIIGAGAGFLNGNVYQGLSGLQMVVLMLQGEANFGREAATALANNYIARGELIQDGEVLDYIRGIGDKITRFMGRKDLEYEYYVVKDDKLNAFALPGGKVFINTGAILQTNSEAELAGLLGHEISHAVLSHGFLRIAESSLLNNLSLVVPFLNYVSPLITAQYSQENERQADILGTRVLPLSNYAADGLLNVMVTFKKIYGDAPTNYLSTHPAPVERLQYLEKIIRDNRFDRYAYEGVKKHQKIQQKLQTDTE
ncbi:M48 family metallopeptidase [Pannus brasiliensis CCIBt3594]|uniref:M48 family metallopeptidase n=1 Tax=Pannus brasiliensis CCIBt3594 TaxID=1427578 RepID=A0AAW9QSN6_9CHRO